MKERKKPESLEIGNLRERAADAEGRLLKDMYETLEGMHGRPLTQEERDGLRAIHRERKRKAIERLKREHDQRGSS